MNSTQEQRLREAEAQLDYELTERKIRTIESLLYKATADAVLRESSPSEYVTPDIISKETGWGNGRALRVSTIDDYKDGQFRPVYENERDLQEIRGCGRVLATSDEMAIAVCKNLAGYVVGEGGEYAVKPKLKGQELELVAEVQRFVDEFVEANDLEDCGETDVLLTSVIDGDCLEALIARGSYAPEVELIGAETIMEPQNFREVEDYIGEVGLNWRFGVASLPGRPQKVMGYFAARQDGDWDFFPADEAVFTKRNAPKQCKRGVSDFYAPYKRITRGAKLFDYSVMGATIQASIAYIKEHATGTPEAALSSALDSRLRRDVTAAKGDGSVVSVTGMDTLPGRILNVAGTKYHAGPMGSPQGPLYMDVYQAVARRVGSRWQMPEYMISGDASNANYASTLAAESPFVKAMKGEQGGLAKSRKELIWKAIAIAAKHGRFGGMTAADLYQRVVVEVTYPSVEVRDPLAQEQVFDSQQAAGVLSVKTRAAKSGLDYEDELANGAKEKQENPLAGLMGGQQGFGGQPFGGQVRESVAGRDGDGDGLVDDGKPTERPAPKKTKKEAAAGHYELKMETVDDVHSGWMGKYKVGKERFGTKKDANAFIAERKKIRAMADISDADFLKLDEKQQKAWMDEHDPEFYKLEGTSERKKILDAKKSQIRLAKYAADQLRPDGTPKNVFDYWAESGREWDKMSHVAESLTPKDGDGDGLINDGKPDEGPAPPKKTRAKSGGETGVNGYFYKGGQFLPTTDMPPKVKAGVTRAASGKSQVDNGRWEVVEPGKWPPHELIGRVFVSDGAGKFKLNNDTALEYQGITGEQREMAVAIMDRYNAGERLLNVNDIPFKQISYKYIAKMIDAGMPVSDPLKSRVPDDVQKYLDKSTKVPESFDPYALAAKLLWEGYEAPHILEGVAGRDGDGDGLVDDGKPTERPAPKKAKEKKITVDDLDSVPAGKRVVYYGGAVGYNLWTSRGDGQYRSERDEPRDADTIRRYIKDFGNKDGKLIVLDAEPAQSKAAPASPQETPLMNPKHEGFGKNAAASDSGKASDWSSVSSSEKILKQRANDMFRTTELTKDQWTSVAADVYFNNNNVSKAFKGHKKYADAVAKHFLDKSDN